MTAKLKRGMRFRGKKPNRLPSKAPMGSFIRLLHKIQHQLESSLKHTKEIIINLNYLQATSDNANINNQRDSPQNTVELKQKKTVKINNLNEWMKGE